MHILAKPTIPRSLEFMLGCGAVLIFAAKLGDVLLGRGGACILHHEAGVKVSLIVTSNELNCINSDKDGDKHLAVGIALTDMARIVGYEWIQMWSDMKSEIIIGGRPISCITKFLGQIHPNLIYLPFVNDPDHGRATFGLAIVEAVRRSQIPCCLAMYEVGPPLQPDHFLDITNQYHKNGRRQVISGLILAKAAFMNYHWHTTNCESFP